jgi:type III secretory pathway lipoprotein EscJ
MKAINAVYNILSNNAALTAVVSTRINPLRIPQESSFPAISYQMISVIPHPSKSGTSKSDFARVQINSFGLTYQSAVQVADLVRNAMQLTLPATFNSVFVQTCEFDSEMHLTDDNAAFSGVYHIAQDYIINYNK